MTYQTKTHRTDEKSNLGNWFKRHSTVLILTATVLGAGVSYELKTHNIAKMAQIITKGENNPKDKEVTPEMIKKLKEFNPKNERKKIDQLGEDAYIPLLSFANAIYYMELGQDLPDFKVVYISDQEEFNRIATRTKTAAYYDTCLNAIFFSSKDNTLFIAGAERALNYVFHELGHAIDDRIYDRPPSEMTSMFMEVYLGVLAERQIPVYDLVGARTDNKGGFMVDHSYNFVTHLLVRDAWNSFENIRIGIYDPYDIGRVNAVLQMAKAGDMKAAFLNLVNTPIRQLEEEAKKRISVKEFHDAVEQMLGVIEKKMLEGPYGEKIEDVHIQNGNGAESIKPQVQTIRKKMEFLRAVNDNRMGRTNDA